MIVHTHTHFGSFSSPLSTRDKLGICSIDASLLLLLLFILAIACFCDKEEEKNK